MNDLFQKIKEFRDLVLKKQDQLIPGENIRIEDNVISANYNGSDIPTKVSQLENDAGYITEMDDKIDKPSIAPEVGTILKVMAVNDDGSYICEWVDEMDIKVDGVSIVEDSTANLNVAGYQDENTILRTGLVYIPKGYGLSFEYNTKNLVIDSPTDTLIYNRRTAWQAYNYALTVRQIDTAVKSAMCDGKGAAWTDAERLAALLRIGCTVDENGFVKWTAQEAAE